MNITVIIPTYNRASWIEGALQSIQKQRFAPYEIIVVDDGSTDESAEILKKYPEIRIIRKLNGGVSSARNSGLLVAKGEWVAFMDIDDRWEADKLAAQVAYIKQHPEVKAVYGKERWFMHDKELTVPKRYALQESVSFEALLEYTFIGPSSVMLKKSLIDSVGLFDETLAACEDFDYWLRVARHCDFYGVDSSIIHKHAGHQDQLSTQIRHLDRYRISALFKHLKSAPELIKPMIEQKLNIVLRGAYKHQNEALITFCLKQIERLNRLQ